MIGGIDLGGTKIEARLFDEKLTEQARHRIPTATESYPALLNSIAQQVRWLEEQSKNITAIGLGSPGLINPRTGVMQTANLPASGQRLAQDISAQVGREITLINDAAAFTLSETRHGANQGHRNIVGLIFGTGVAGGHTCDGYLVPNYNGQNAEFGHLPLPAAFVIQHNLPLLPCGCGLTGCFETYLSGPGLERLAKHLTGQRIPAEDILTTQPDVRNAWIDLAAQLIGLITRTHDPELIILGGGLGMTAGLVDKLRDQLPNYTLGGTTLPKIRQAAHGDASGALGAAIYARDAFQVHS